MKKSESSDKQLENLLRQLPKMEDHRHPRDIYQNLSTTKKRKRPTWLLPGAATVAALLLIFILVPKFFVENNDSFNHSQEEKSSFAEDRSSIPLEKQESIQNDESQADILMMTNQKTALYDYEVGSGKVLTFWIPDPMAQVVVPISTLVHPEENIHWLSLFNESMNKLTEEEWGLTDYYPLNAALSKDDNGGSIVVDVPANHSYGQGSANETIFIQVLNKDVASNGTENKITLKTNGQSGIEFGNFGNLKELDIKQERNRAYFFYYPEGKDIPFMVPSTNEYKDINTALQAMKSPDPNLSLLQASIRSGFEYEDITINDKQLIITMADDLPIKDDTSSLYSFEAILLTAKEFGFESIILNNAPISHLGPFDLAQAIKVPVGVNYQPLQ